MPAVKDKAPSVEEAQAALDAAEKHRDDINRRLEAAEPISREAWHQANASIRYFEKRLIGARAAEQEEREKKQVAAREKARKEFAEELRLLVNEVEPEVEKAADALVQALGAFNTSSAKLSALAGKAAAPGISANRHHLAERVATYIKSRLQAVSKEFKTNQRSYPLQETDAKWLANVEASLKTPLQPRRKAQPAPPPEPVTKYIVEGMQKRDEVGNHVSHSVLVHEDGTVHIVRSPTLEQQAVARSMYVGGYQSEVKPEDIEPLLAAGVAIKEQITNPTTGMYTVKRVITKKEEMASE